MTFETNVPRGDLLPLNERPRYVANWNYIQDKMREDHQWKEDSDRDGHHKKMEMANLTTAIGSGNVDANGDPTALSTAMNGYYYTRPKTATEAPDAAGQRTEPYFASDNAGSLIFNQFGFRAILRFRTSGGSIITNGGNDWDYQHNIASVVRNSVGLYTITMSTDMPTQRYLVLITIEDTNSARRVANVVTGSRTDNSFQIVVRDSALRDPHSVMLVVIGG